MLALTFLNILMLVIIIVMLSGFSLFYLFKIKYNLARQLLQTLIESITFSSHESSQSIVVILHSNNSVAVLFIKVRFGYFVIHWTMYLSLSLTGNSLQVY